MTKKDKTDTEQAGQALCDFLSDFYNGRRRMWLHDFFGDEFQRGQDYALTELALIPEVRSALDARGQEIGSELKRFHEEFKSQRESESKESQ